MATRHCSAKRRWLKGHHGRKIAKTASTVNVAARVARFKMGECLMRTFLRLRHTLSGPARRPMTFGHVRRNGQRRLWDHTQRKVSRLPSTDTRTPLEKFLIFGIGPSPVAAGVAHGPSCTEES